MASYRIVCTDQLPVHQPTTHAHIVSVGTGDDPKKANDKWTLGQVIGALANGHSFYTMDSQGNKTYVETCICSYCNKQHIRSKPNATTSDNLDSLRRCSWK